jgi:citrate synthase
VDGPPLRRAIDALAGLATVSHPVLGRAPVALRSEAPRIVGTLASAFGAQPDEDAPLHRRLGFAWGLDDEVSDLIRRTLVLLADQELTTSAFAARVVASTGAALASCVLAGMAALSGPLHGGATSRVRSLFEDVARLGPRSTVGHYLAAGLPIPGFGHALSPEGDPRATALLGAFSPPDAFEGMITEMQAETGLRPTVDIALEAMRVRCGLPRDAPFTLFALARSVGMIAHAVEQAHSGDLIRPRARYIGTPTAST